ncbi:MAG: segregation/condensation protein A [Balneolaceae bacterium]
MYKVQLKNFEGPLDLLLFFIKRDELDIYDIPISHITREFLDYIRLMEELDLDIASEFIYMASLLMSIKARMMLPSDSNDDEEMDEFDPRYELVQKLLEYKRYKEMAEKLTVIDEEARQKYFRGFHEADTVDAMASGEALQDVTIFDLMSAFRNVLADIKKKNVYHRVEKVETTIEDQSDFLRETLRRRGRLSFRELSREIGRRIVIVVTFLAALEMLKEQEINLFVENDDPTDFYLDLKPVEEILGENTSTTESTLS